MPGLTPPPVVLHALIGHPKAVGHGAALPEYVDRNATARVPVAADTQPARRHLVEQALPYADGHILVKTAMIAEASEKQLEAFRFHDGLARRVVDHQMREIGLTGNGAQRCEFGRGKAHAIQTALARIGYVIQL